MTKQNLPNRVRPWQRAVALALIALIACSPVGARGPGRAGIAALIEEPDILPPTGANQPANLMFSLDPTLGLPGNPTIAGALVDAKGPQAITISADSVVGRPASTTFGAPMNSSSGELMVPLVGVTPDAFVNGHLAIPAVSAHVGKIDLIPPLVSLKTVPIPPVLGLEIFVRDKPAAIALGKALFWDSKVGSDGLACASCHSHAGADSRLTNQLNPGQRGGDNTFNKTATGGGGPNYTLKPGDFPFLKLMDPLDRNSAVLFETNDVVSSQGTFSGDFLSLQPNGVEKCGNRPVDEFSVHGLLTRRVAPRNTPSVINAVFNFRNFWDGRANNVFNGNNPFGNRDTGAKVLQAKADGTAAWVGMQLANASLASQAVGPALSDFEMSCANKTFKQLGRKMLMLRALSTQDVHPDDSVLASYRHGKLPGLSSTYDQMIKQAFEANWWRASGTFDGYTQMETNFSMFWGIAIMMYESTLVSDEAPIDKFAGWAGTPADPNALSMQEKRGLALFRGPKASCVQCHRGAEFTGAGAGLQPNQAENLSEHMFVGAGQLGMYDNGFYNIGVRPTVEDIGVGGPDPFGNSLSFSRQYLDKLRGKAIPDSFAIRPCLFAIKTDAIDCWTHPDPKLTRVGVDGAFKTPSLRNVALTQPYFHNGSQFTLEQVVDFYNRGGDRRGNDGNDTTGMTTPDATNGGASNVHPQIRPLGLTPLEKADLVAFMRNALTDRRVACKQAPFDHPELRITNGHVGDAQAVTARNNDIKAMDAFINLPAVGAKGLPKGECLKNDDARTQVLPGIGNGQKQRDDRDTDERFRLQKIPGVRTEGARGNEISHNGKNGGIGLATRFPSENVGERRNLDATQPALFNGSTAVSSAPNVPGPATTVGGIVAGAAISAGALAQTGANTVNVVATVDGATSIAVGTNVNTAGTGITNASLGTSISAVTIGNTVDVTSLNSNVSNIGVTAQVGGGAISNTIVTNNNFVGINSIGDSNGGVLVKSRRGNVSLAVSNGVTSSAFGGGEFRTFSGDWTVPSTSETLNSTDQDGDVGRSSSNGCESDDRKVGRDCQRSP